MGLYFPIGLIYCIDLHNKKSIEVMYKYIKIKYKLYF